MTRVVVPVGLFLAGCAPRALPEPPLRNPPPPPVAEPVAPAEEGEPEILYRNPPPPLPTALPTWDEVPSPHPPGATNPPSPVLLRTPGGQCHKQWVSPFLPAEYRRDRVTPCPSPDEVVGDCGTEIECPPDAVQRTAPKP